MMKKQTTLNTSIPTLLGILFTDAMLIGMAKALGLL